MQTTRPHEPVRSGFGTMDQFAGAVGGLPPPRILMNGDRLDIQASVDLEGLKKLQEMLTKYQAILEMLE